MTLNIPPWWFLMVSVAAKTIPTATMTLTNSTLNYEAQGGNNFEVGDAGNNPVNAVFNQYNSTVNMNANQWFVGNSTNAVATYNVSSGTINVHDWVVIGRNGATGTMNMTGGTINKNNSSFITASGNAAVGTFNMSAGTINDTGEYWLAEHAGDIGTNNISGTAQLNLHNWKSLGRGGLEVVNFPLRTIPNSNHLPPSYISYCNH